ncbi:glycosyltransferase [Vibrio tubiashii]|uniref:glycosyltransferase n=1 Tax=Vibrio tubiashii TaxID=29498 RepID=UPI00234F89AF|nr:glycosyltransferase [Vibrio tubiashii]WCP67279.1 glycosyltransferase [Vibrio tubiashii]
MQSILNYKSDDGKLPIPEFMRFLVKFRADLRIYDDMTLEDRLCLLFWWQVYGSHLYSSVEWNIDDDSDFINYIRSLRAGELIGKYPKLVLAWMRFPSNGGLLVSKESELFESLVEDSTGVPCFFSLIFKFRPDLVTLSSNDFNSKCSLLRWWFDYGVSEYVRMKDAVNSKQIFGMFDLEEPFNELSLLKLVYSQRDDLKEAFPDYNLNYTSLLNWWKEYGVREYKVVIDLLNATSIETEKTLKSNGVNVIGFHKGVLGLGEDARLSCAAIRDSGRQVAAITPPIAGPSSILDLAPEYIDTNHKLFDVSLFCLPPTEMFRLAIEGGSELLRGNDYKIGFWPWELPVWPKDMELISDFVDEVWAQSEYVKSCFERIEGLKVKKMPMVVEVPKPSPQALCRDKYKIHDDAFVCFIMFDGNSWLTRKNPVAAVKAYINAFVSDDLESKTKLVIKTMNLNHDDVNWLEVIKLISGRNDVIIIDEVMSRQETVNLINACDCYISLHRSEGFGRIIAEAMLLGKSVVVSDFSGSQDFCNENNSYLVEGKLVGLKRGDYIFDEGQFWFDASIDSAIEQLRIVHSDAILRERKVKAAKEFIQKKYSYNSAASFIHNRLDTLSEDR